MRKILGILFILVCSVQCTVYAVTYQTYRPASGTSFRSTSAYIAPTGTPYTVHCTPSTMSSTVHCTPYTVHSTPSTVHQSLSAISASNFTALNSEGGAFYRASSVKPHIRREGRDDDDEEGEGGNAIGEYDFHSPVGDTPWILFALLTAAYVGWRKRIKSSKL